MGMDRPAGIPPIRRRIILRHGVYILQSYSNHSWVDDRTFITKEESLAFVKVKVIWEGTIDA